MAGFSRLPLFLLPVLLFSMLQKPTFAIKKSYVVYLGSHSHGPEISQADLDLAEQSHYEFLAGFVGTTEAAKESIFYCYTRHINGFAAALDEEKATEIAKHPKVISVFPNKRVQLHTTRSWDFLGLEENGAVLPGSIWEKARYGEDIIIGNVDSGVWPESKSFNDEGYGPIPSRWKGGCVDTANPNKVRCNRKLIGAKPFSKGYEFFAGPLNASLTSVRDGDGHGTHTLSTAAGNFVQNANFLGVGNGTAKGGSPRARVASYKVCWQPTDNHSDECYEADILAACDAAIHDGVDILSMSLGIAPTNYFNDSMAIGSFHAVKNGILVVASAGNEAQEGVAVSNSAPWLLTVAASTLDRTFGAYLKLGNNMQLKGTSINLDSVISESKMHPLVSGIATRVKNASAEEGLFCNAGSLDPELVMQNILVCMFNSTIGSENISKEAHRVGAKWIILVNEKNSKNNITVKGNIPMSQLSYTDGLLVYKYINSTKVPTIYVLPTNTTELGKKQAPIMASFSSQGPNTVTPEILKPDITAPGVNIIASSPLDTSGTGFTTLSGTSMSCPHVAGVSGLLKSLYPHWSPAAIKSAIMTTATTRDNLRKPIVDSSLIKATPFNYGAGHVQPNRAMDPGLVYDLSTFDYLNFLCAIGYNKTLISLFTETKLPYNCPKPAINLLDLNYPSITVPNLSGSTTLTRTLKNVGSPGTYKAKVHPPSGISVSVEPKILTFDSVGQEKTFKLTLKTKSPAYAKNYVFGKLKWSDGHHHVRSQIVVKAAAAI